MNGFAQRQVLIQKQKVTRKSAIPMSLSLYDMLVQVEPQHFFETHNGWQRGKWQLGNSLLEYHAGKKHWMTGEDVECNKQRARDLFSQVFCAHPEEFAIFY